MTEAFGTERTSLNRKRVPGLNPAHARSRPRSRSQPSYGLLSDLIRQLYQDHDRTYPSCLADGKSVRRLGGVRCSCAMFTVALFRCLHVSAVQTSTC